MLETYCRPFYQRTLVDPLAHQFGRYRINAITVTLLGCIAGITAAVFIVLAKPWYAVFALLLSGYLDTLDGTLARMQQSASHLGSMLDILADRVVEFAIILGLFYVDPLTRGGLCLSMLGAVMLCVCAFLLVGIFVEKSGHKSFYYSPGLVERAEAFIFFILMILLPQWFYVLSVIFIVLVLYTAVHHVVKTIKHCNQSREFKVN